MDYKVNYKDIVLAACIFLHLQFSGLLMLR